MYETEQRHQFRGYNSYKARAKSMDMNELVEAIKAHGDLDDATLIEAGRHGADAGWGGFTYTGDCVEFYDENKALVWKLLEEGADSMGCKSVPEFVGQFNRADMADDEDGFKNLCAWYALEEAGRWLADNIDDLKEEATDEFRDDFELFKSDVMRDQARAELDEWTGTEARAFVEATEHYKFEDNRPVDFDRVNWDEIAEAWEDDYQIDHESEQEDKAFWDKHDAEHPEDKAE